MSDRHWQFMPSFAACLVCACGATPENGSEELQSGAQALLSAVPGRIEAENYQRAFDSTPTKNHGAYITECDHADGVDLDRSYDTNDHGCVVGWTTAGEWLEFDIESPIAQRVDITARVASDLFDRQFHLSLDGVSLGQQAVPSTGSWAYADVTTHSGIALSAGPHVLRVTFDSDSINLNYLDITKVSAPRVETLLEATGAVASSLEYSIYPASAAIDGDSTTRWSSSFADPQWITLDLGARKQISRAILNWEVAASSSYQIGVSDSSDGPWTVVHSTTTGDGGVDDISFSPVVARYVRMYSSARSTPWGNSLYDFDVYGEVAPTPGCEPQISAAPNDGASIPTGTLLLEPPDGPPRPDPIWEPAFSPPTAGVGCLFNCFNGSVLDGDRLVAAAALGGTVHTFVKSAGDGWTSEAPLSNPEPRPSEPPNLFDRSFGLHLALEGDDLLVSGTALDGTPKVYVYRRAGSAWRLQQTLPVAADDLALDHGTALIANSQDVRAYRRADNGSYRLQSIFSSPAEAPFPDTDPGFGSEISLDENVAVIAAPGLGGAYAYTRCAELWSFAQKLSPSDSSTANGFATAVSVSGTQIAVGAKFADGPSPYRPGAVVLFELAGPAWQPTSVIRNPIPEDGQYRQFGVRLALRNNLLLATYSTSYPYAATVHDYLFDVGGAPRFLAALHSAGGRSVQISGRRALVDVSGWRYGTIPNVFELSPASAP